MCPSGRFHIDEEFRKGVRSECNSCHYRYYGRSVSSKEFSISRRKSETCWRMLCFVMNMGVIHPYTSTKMISIHSIIVIFDCGCLLPFNDLVCVGGWMYLRTCVGVRVCVGVADCVSEGAVFGAPRDDDTVHK